MRASAYDPAGALPLHPARGQRPLDPAFSVPPKAENGCGSGASGPSGIQGQRPWWGRGAKPLAFLLLATLALTACGRKGPPVPPGPPDQVIYPRTYPAR